MPNEPLPVTQIPRALDTILTGGPTVEAPFLTLNGNGDWVLSTTGPEDGYWESTGSGLKPSASAVAHDAAFFKRINGDYFIK